MNLIATAIDAEDGYIGSAVEWNSNVDGPLGTGASLEVQISAGTHTITASVTDAGGRTVSSDVTLTVNAAE